MAPARRRTVEVPVSHAPSLAQLPLNDAQRRHLAVALEQLDEALQEAIGGPPAVQGSALRPRVSDVPAAVALPLAGHARQLRERLRVSAGTLGLAIAPESARRRLLARLTAAEMLLHDARPKAMRAYGPVAPEVATALDPFLTELIGEVQQLRWLLDREDRPDGTLA